MRIISGKYKGRVIRLPKYFHDRPTTDFAKEGLFSILDNWYYFDQIKVLDLFAGSGCISYEFASRGVPLITIVEKNPRYVNFIRSQIKSHFSDDEIVFNVIRDDAFSFLRERTLDYDIIFADPPFDLESIASLPDLAMANPSLPDDSIFILEHPREIDFSRHPNFFRHKHYGHVNFSFFSKTTNQ